MKIEAEICVCDECGNEWIAETDEPERCPSRKCRKRSWDRSGIRLGVDEQLGFANPKKNLKTKPESSSREGSSAARASVSKTEDDGSSPSRPAKWVNPLAKLNEAKYGKKKQE